MDSVVTWPFNNKNLRWSRVNCMQGRIQDFKLGGAHLKNLRRAEGGAKFVLVFRVKNHDFTPKNHIFSNCGGKLENFGVFRVKNHDFMPKNHIFSNFRRGRAGRASPPLLDPPLVCICLLANNPKHTVH